LDAVKRAPVDNVQRETLGLALHGRGLVALLQSTV
jgi:hypothetical protein